MSKFDYDLIVIGGGAAGLTASTFAGQSSAKTLLIEKEKKLGGDCLHYGCVPSKSLIKSSHVYNLLRRSEDYGLPKVDLPAVDLRRINQRIHNIINTIQAHDEPEYLAKKFNVETKFGSPRFIDRHTISLNGINITSRYFVIATGSSPIVPSIEGLNSISYLTNLNIFSLQELPESLVVLGGGPIGLEMAQAFARLGSKVTVIQSGDQILPKEDPDVAEFMKERLEFEGVKIVLHSRAVKVAQEGSKVTVYLDCKKEGKKTTVQGEAILVATGRRPNVEGMDLGHVGVDYTTKGIITNERMQTTVKNIYACGDVTGGLLFTHVASYEAIVAIYNCILKIPKKKDYRNAPWVTYLDPEIASIGFNERRAKEAGLSFKVQIDYLNHNDRALAEGEQKGFIKMLIDRKKGRPIGVQIVSYHAGDLISEWIPVLNGKMTLSMISNAIHPYPTMAEMNKASSVNYIVSTIPPWTKKLTKFLFGYKGVA